MGRRWALAVLGVEHGGFGERVGKAGLVVAGSGPDAEIYVTSRSWAPNYRDFWFAVRHIPGTDQYEQSFISEASGTNAGTSANEINRLVLFHTPVPDRPLAIAVAFTNGNVQLFDQATKKLLGTQADPCSAHNGLATIATRDLDGDGWDEFISWCRDNFLIVHGFTYATWTLAGPAVIAGAGDIVVGQMDDDPALEIALSDGRVIDAGTRVAQWTSATVFGESLQAADIDGDGRDELLAANHNVTAYDVEQQSIKWTIPVDAEKIVVADIDANGVQELLIGDGFPDRLRVYDLATQLEEWSIKNPGLSFDNMAVGDVNDDGVLDLIWGGGAGASDPDQLYIADWRTRAIVWQNAQLDGPFVGPVVGDLDGDGIPELVYASSMSDRRLNSGRIVVVDSRTMKLRAISPGVAGGTNARNGIRDLKLRDLDGDGRQEILVATDWAFTGLIEAYSFDSSNAFVLKWTNATRPARVAFGAVEVADIDGDGDLEVLATTHPFGGDDGEFIYAYDVTTHAEEFHTGQLGDHFYYPDISDLVVAQLDDDPALEFVGLVSGGAAYVFDGVTHQLEGAIDVTGGAIAGIDPSFGVKGLFIGTTTGHVGLWTFNGVTYSEVAGWNFGTKPIDGVELTADGGLAVGTDGTVQVFREGATYHSGFYGDGFGRSLQSLNGGRVVLSGGEHGVHALIVRP